MRPIGTKTVREVRNKKMAVRGNPNNTNEFCRVLCVVNQVIGPPCCFNIMFLGNQVSRVEQSWTKNLFSGFVTDSLNERSVDQCAMKLRQFLNMTLYLFR